MATPSRSRRAAAVLLCALLLPSCAGPGRPAADPAGEESDWVVTIHGAVLLPFTPVGHGPWDGPPDVAAPIPEAAGFLAELARALHVDGASLARAASMVVAWARSAVEPPDAYPVVLLGDGTFGGPALADADDFQPQWDLRVPVRASARDPRILSLRVRDADLSDDDNVGEWQTPLGALLSGPPVQEVSFLDADGRPRAGGIAVLRISVERRGP